ncbi:MAG TPA: hypothetical protein VE010_02700 [Thermoanaerobaculia bacterium]|nr:hypothetical protein [Thermoanaerobaculia bacterium]
MNVRFTHLADSLVARFDPGIIDTISRPCRPRILVVADGGLNFNPASGFGLTRFLEGITVHSGVATKPILTLAYRGGVHAPGTVTIGLDTYTILNNYNFANPTTGVNLERYDQVWLFGISGGAFTINNNELLSLSLFMNSGGGVFATGDHATLGRQMSGGLPRIRHMREWASIPMGSEVPSVAVNRIDTVVDPGVNNIYEFNDQADEIPQRIYPNYKVTGATNTTWQATVHPLMMLPGAAATRSDNTGFTKDLDVLPDHPHESVCYATPAGALGGTYNLQGQNFEEFRPSVANPAVRVGAEIVAYAVSGGRSVHNLVWKPPVRPQMFGVISAYDGRLAQPYSGTTRPGRIVCESTWHHYVNVNLDGTGTGRTALFTMQAGVLVPGPHLLKIYAYYRNIVRWLQPANRVTCQFLWDIAAIRFDENLIEELEGFDGLDSWDGMVAIGRTAERVLDEKRGSAALSDTIAALLNTTGQTALGELFVTREFQETPVDTRELMLGILGGAVVKAAQMFPINDAKAALAGLERGVEKNAKELLRETSRVTKIGFDARIRRAEQSLAVFSDKALRKGLE